MDEKRDEELEAGARGNRIRLIQLIRACTYLGLGEAKRVVDMKFPAGRGA